MSPTEFGRALPADTPLIARLWHKSTHEPGGCYQWHGTKNDGYGQVSIGSGVRAYAHRAAYELVVGPIPEGMQLDHLCRNRACWNPAHLEPVTNFENQMRSPVAFSAINAQKTHCPQGHELSGDNLELYVNSGGRNRKCATCERDRKRRQAPIWNERRRQRYAERRAALGTGDREGGR